LYGLKAGEEEGEILQLEIYCHSLSEAKNAFSLPST
jgi:hypothetical protein